MSSIRAFRLLVRIVVHVPYGVVLLFSDADREGLTDYSAELGRHSDRRIAIGPEAPPHLTLAHSSCEPQAAMKWWEDCSNVLPRATSIRFAGVLVSVIPDGDYYVPEGGVYVGLEALKEPILELHHRAVLASARKAGADLIGAVGDDFRPHVTLAVLRHGPVEVPPPPVAFLEAREARPALGRLGPYGTFPEILAEM